MTDRKAAAAALCKTEALLGTGETGVFRSLDIASRKSFRRSPVMARFAQEARTTEHDARPCESLPARRNGDDDAKQVINEARLREAIRRRIAKRSRWINLIIQRSRKVDD